MVGGIGDRGFPGIALEVELGRITRKSASRCDRVRSGAVKGLTGARYRLDCVFAERTATLTGRHQRGDQQSRGRVAWIRLDGGEPGQTG